MSCFFAQYLLLFLLVCADSAYSQVHYYITPSLNVPCSQDPCLTLSQFAADSTSYLDNETNITLSFLPGNHLLDRELSLSCADNFSMKKDIGGNGTVFVQCASQSGRFNISETTFATVQGLHFVGCGGNRVSQVEQFIVEDTIFWGMEGRGTALVLTKVSDAIIARSSFLLNTHGNTFEYYGISCYYASNQERLINYLYLKRNPRLAVGGALYAAFSNVLIVSSQFTNNTAEIGGALFACNSSLHVVGSTYSYNRASFGGVMITSESSVTIDRNIFSKNVAWIFGGVAITYQDSFSISGSTFTHNSASYSGVMETYDSLFIITDSTFSDNMAQQAFGVIYAVTGFFVIRSTNFTKNSATYEGGVMTASNSSVNIDNSTFSKNVALVRGGVMMTYNASVSISGTTFTHNSAGGIKSQGSNGVIWAYESLFNITDSSFSDNRVEDESGVIFAYRGSLSIRSSSFTNSKGGVIGTLGYSSVDIASSTFTNNSATLDGRLMFIAGSSIYISNCTFDHNLGSLYSSNSNLTFSGYTRLENCAEPSNKIASVEYVVNRQGGAITSIQSTVILTGAISMLNNQARHGGAILATGSKIVMYGETTIANNTATNSNGGGISLHQSDLEIKGNCNISNNYAMRGGGIHATSSTITVYQPGTLQFINNTAENGGGLYLEVNPKLYILKPQTSSIADEHLLIFSGNRANCGGAVYVADETNSGACSPDNECFTQTLTLALFVVGFNVKIVTANVFFSDNVASEQGANLFGGLLDRCIPSPFAEVCYINERTHYSGVSYLGNISNITALDTISSLPVRVCFCNSKSEPDCSYQPPPIKVKKGETFTVSLVAVDQVNHSVDANIINSLSYHDGGFREGQQTQNVGRNCTNITFNVFSPHDSETMNLFADGPCGSSTLSIRHLNIQFTNCTCPVGFEPSNSETRCECFCDPELSPYITNCNSKTESLERVNTNSWITYVNVTDPPGYVIHSNCPFDYCQPPSKSVNINLNHPNGADTQCAYNHRGILCGACQEHLSLSLGSSRCLSCPSYWPALFVVIVLAAILAGILLMVTLLALNMTVTVGLIDGFIFYVNIVSANSAVFFPSSEPSFPTVFVAWLNLDVGFDVCFFDGLDAYIKTWLQLAFPVYIISLVIIVIIVSEYSPQFARLIGKRDPVATLATLILLSYAKLLSITITALSFAVLDYPDGSHETVWLPDGHVKYFQGKHIALVIVALLIILIGVPYTILLFLWQWLVHASRWRLFKWTNNTKLNVFISVHHVPCNSKHRYWTGLLLLVRVVLYITASITMSNSNKPQTALLVTIILVVGLFFLKGIIGKRVYKNSITDVLQTGVYLNLLAFAVFNLYNFKDDIKKQTAVAYTSTIIILILLVGVIIYHVSVLVRKDKLPEEVNENLLTPVQSVEAEVTHSFIESPHDQSPPPKANIEEIEVKVLTCTNTPVYQ